MPDEPIADPAFEHAKTRPTVGGTVRALLRGRIVTGILTVIPLYVTYAVIKFVFGLMKGATEPVAQFIATGLAEESPNERVQHAVTQYMEWLVPALAVFMTLFLLYLAGLFSANVVGRRIITWAEQLFEKLPLVKTVYRSTKQVVMTFAGGGQMGFQRVVLIEFPRKGMKCIGFLTGVLNDQDTGRQLCCVFIPTTPNPTTGYMQIVPLEEVSETSWSVDATIKTLMSGGVLCPRQVPFEVTHVPAVGTPIIKPAGAKPIGVSRPNGSTEPTAETAPAGQATSPPDGAGR